MFTFWFCLVLGFKPKCEQNIILAAAHKHGNTEEKNNTREKGKIPVLFTLWFCSLLGFKPKSEQNKFLAAAHKHTDTEEKNNIRENGKMKFWMQDTNTPT